MATKSTLPKHFLTPVLLLLVAMVAAGGYVLSQAPDSTGGSTSSRPLAAPAPTQEDVAAQQVFLNRQFGGESGNSQHRALVARVGEAITTRSEVKDSGKRLRFIVLAEPDVINSFALPTGEVYVTTALVNRMQTEGQLAATLANGAAHVLNSHRMEPQKPANDGTPEASVLKFSTAQETAADQRAIKIMADAGYTPEGYLSLFRVLTEAYHAGANVQFFATHPSADWRLSAVAENIKKLYPEGIPEYLSK